MDYHTPNHEFIKFFQTFQYCAIHLFWMENNNADNFQQNILHLLSISPPSPKFSLIQTTNSRYNLSEYDAMLETIPAMTQTDLEYNSKLYRKIFQPLKFNSIFTLQLPIFKSLERKHVETYFEYIHVYTYHLHFKDIKYTADLIILPIYLHNRNITELGFKVEDSLHSSRIIFFSQIFNKIYVPCSPLAIDCWKGNDLRWLLKEWDEINFIRYFPGVNTNGVSNDKQSYDYYWDANNLCPYNGKRLNYMDLNLDNQVIEYCAKAMISASLNCTSMECKDIIRAFYTVINIASEDPDSPKFPQYSPYGASFHGYRYSVFINTQNNNKKASDLNALRLLSPFSFIEWVVLIANVMILGCILKASGIQRVFFWLYGILVEQDDTKCKYITKVNWYLVFFWLYGSYLIRALYTSSLYTYMTKEPGPTEIPTSFYELVFNNSMQILGSIVSNHDFSMIGILKASSSISYVKLFNQTLLKTWWYSNDMENLFLLANSDNLLEHQEKYLCGKYFGIIVYGKKNALKFLQDTETKVQLSIEIVQKCTNLNRFAWLYKTNQNVNSGYIHETSLYTKLLLMLFGEYILIENKDPVVFPELNIWTGRQLDYLSKDFSRKLGVLVESGIYSYQSHYLDLVTQRQAIDQFVQKSGFDNKISWFSLVDHMVSKCTSFGLYSPVNYQVSESLGRIYQNKGLVTGTMEDFRYVWVFYFVLITVVCNVFLVDLSLYCFAMYWKNKVV